MSTPLQEALERLSIVDVWQATGGGELRHGRGQAFWRCGNGYNVALDLDRERWFDHAAGVGGGVLALVSTALRLTPGQSAQWLIELAGIEDKPLTRAARLERHTAERDAEEARLFAVAADALAERCLEADSLFDPSRPDITELMRDVQRDPVAVFRSYRRDYTQLTAGLVFAGRRELERREIAAARELTAEVANAA